MKASASQGTIRDTGLKRLRKSSPAATKTLIGALAAVDGKEARPVYCSKRRGIIPSIMRPEDNHEASLIERICLGERDLFHDPIRPYERKIYLTVLALLGSEAEAEDAAQETMIKAFRHLRSFRSESRFSTWLVSIALNEARSRLRKSKRAQIESLDEDAESYEGDFTPALLTDWREIPSEALERSELRATLQLAVAELPPDLPQKSLP